MGKSNIVLIGMPGAGKSTIGVILAKTLGKTFIDTDLVIQEKEKQLLQNIIDKEGIEGFLKVEERIVSNLKAENSVIATGGSVVYSSSAMENLKTDGIAIYLKLECEEIERRINNIKTRGIAMGQNQNLSDLYLERIPLYLTHADISIDCNDKNVEEIINEIIENKKLNENDV